LRRAWLTTNVELLARRDRPYPLNHIAIGRRGADVIAGIIPANDGETNMEQLALTVAEACAAARIGRTSLYAAPHWR
jgi:hypothetical protein